MKRILALLALALLATTAHAQTTPASGIGVPPITPAILGPAGTPETKTQKDARMAWWREARFGMFIHWGVYSVPAGFYKDQPIPGIGEWIMNNASIPTAEYRKFATQFNPQKFNADDFVSAAKAAGMKYIVITAKHHDGFAMFKSADPFNIVDATPFKRDVIKELSTAAHKQGIHFGVYYSQSQDWNHPGGYAYPNQQAPRRPAGTHWDPAAQDGNFDDYVNQVAIPQVRELLTNIQPEILWWDTPNNISLDQATKLHDLLKLQPNIITNNRLVTARVAPQFIGDTETPEQNIPANGFPGGRDWETCMTINGTWGYKSNDTNFKTTETLLRNLIDIASKGGNYLLNVGPTAEGLIPQPELDRLAEMGKWLQINGEAIYGTGPNPFNPYAAPGSTAPAPGAPRAPVEWIERATSKLDANHHGKVYLHIFKWPQDGQLVLPLDSLGFGFKNAYLLSDATHKPYQISTLAGGIAYQVITGLPKEAPDPIASVVVLETE